jgi:hypothetical protein
MEKEINKMRKQAKKHSKDDKKLMILTINAKPIEEEGDDEISGED